MKGITFSVIIVLITLSLLSLIAVQKSMISTYSEKMSIGTRIDAMNNLYDSITADSSNAMNIITKRALSSADSFVITSGIGLSQANNTVVELVVNGTLNNTPQVLMQGATINDWKNKMMDIGNQNGFITNLTIRDVKVLPYDTWNVLSVLTMSINLSDQNGVASLTRNVSISQKTPIDGLEDPLVSLNTLGRATNIIQRSPYWGNFTQNLGGGNWDINNLKNDTFYSFYHPSAAGASFLDRLEGKLQVQSKYQSITNQTIGLESFVSKGYYTSVGIPVDIEKTNIDYLFFSAAQHPGNKVKGMETTSFRIDMEMCGNQNHTALYNVSQLVI